MVFRKSFLAILILGLIAAAPASGQDCWDYSEILGQLVTNYGSDIWDVVLDGDYAFVCPGGFLGVLDVSDPAFPVLRQSYSSLPGNMLEQEGDRLYLVNGETITILNCSDPLDLVSLGVYQAAGTPKAIDPDGNYLYVALETIVEIVDATDPGQMAQVGTIPGFPSSIKDISVDEGMAVVLAGTYRYPWYFDVSDPAQPVFVDGGGSSIHHGEFGEEEVTSYDYTAVEVVGNLAYLGGLYRFVDYNEEGENQSYPYLSVKRLTIPIQSLDYFSIFNSYPFNSSDPVIDLVPQGDVVTVLFDDTIKVYDSSDPTDLSLTDTFTVQDGGNTLDREGELFAVTTGSLALFSTLLNPEIMDFSSHRSSWSSYFKPLQHMYHRDDYSFVLWYRMIYESSRWEYNQLVDVYDMSDPEEPVFVNRLVDSSSHMGLEYVYYDFDLTMIGDKGLILPKDADEDANVNVFDASDPLDSARLENLKAGTSFVYADDLAVCGDALYTVHEDLLQVIDFSTVPAYIPDPPAAGGYDLQVAGELLFSTDGQSVWALDVSTPLSPVLVSRCLETTVEQFLGAGENLVFCREGNDVFWYPARSDGVIIEAGRVTPNFPAQEAVIKDGILYLNLKISKYESLMQVVNIQDPAAPEMLGNVRTDICMSLTLQNDLLYLGDGEDLLTLPLECRSGGTSVPGSVPTAGGKDGFRLQAAPNPFNPVTEISFYLDQAQAVSLKIFDLRGKRVTLLADGVHPAGENRLTWRGTDSAGREVASGTYFARIEAGGFSETKKMTLLK